ncbi:unnamed protein product [Cylindrotheca closterium]|uniref:Uncharacterized protein n=1 Tax=Cylindrotheca closterium TaxID=2856 RepID=A0AAD2FXQ8_9STRA|nr:unnamed protein product [Cylindrotheca closterium]
MSTGTVLKTCSYKKRCSQKTDAHRGLVEYANLTCPKHFHTSCSQAQVLNKHNLNIMKINDGEVFWACTKACYLAIQSSKASSRVPWDKDGPNGPTDPVNSETILTANNYSNYRGGNGSKGTSKTHPDSHQISSLLKTKGIKIERTAEQVRDKIGGIEQAYKVARDFMYIETGVGLLATDEGSFQDLVRKRCKNFFELEPIFTNRVGISPETNKEMPNDGFGDVGNDLADGDNDSLLGVIGMVGGKNNPVAENRMESPSASTATRVTTPSSTSTSVDKRTPRPLPTLATPTPPGKRGPPVILEQKSPNASKKKQPPGDPVIISARKRIKEETMESFLRTSQSQLDEEGSKKQKQHEENVGLKKEEIS